jgi:hypothetical protein
MHFFPLHPAKAMTSVKLCNQKLCENLNFLGITESSNLHDILISAQQYILADSSDYPDIGTPFSGKTNLTPNIATLRSRKLRVLPVFSSSKISDIHPLGSNLPILNNYLEEPLRSYSSENPKALILLGLVPLISIAESVGSFSGVREIVAIVSDPYEAVAVMGSAYLSNAVHRVRSSGIELHILIEFDQDKLIDKFFDHIMGSMPYSLSSGLIISTPLYHPSHEILLEWIESPEGMATRTEFFWGDSTDEINQLVQAIQNLLVHEPVKFLISPQLPSAEEAIVVASGPSLDSNINWIKQNESSKIIIAAGSAIGTLLAYEIVPDYLVILERDRQIYNDLLELNNSVHLKRVILISSTTSDPRLPSLFADTYYYQRPFSSAACLVPDLWDISYRLPGPESVNAAVETALRLRFRNLYLVGCDLGSTHRDENRSANASGKTDRNLDIPLLSDSGTTIWTCPGLIATRDSLNLLLSLNNETSVFRIGTGLILTGLDDRLTEQANESVRLGGSKNKSPQISALAFSARDTLSPVFSRVLDLIGYCENDIVSAIHASSSWNSSLRDSLLPYITYAESGCDPVEILIRRICRSYLAYATMPLYNCDLESYARYKLASLRSIQNIMKYLRAIFSACASYASSSQSGDHSDIIDYVNRIVHI